MRTIEITNFTDPVCTWCWASEPVFRALETHYPDQIKFRYVMGGLVDDIDNFSDFSNGISAGSGGANAQIISHWLKAADRHGMPVKSEGFHLFSKEFPSTYPQNIAYKAAQMVDPSKADAFLRRMREATAAEAKVTSNPDVQIELASEVGINISDFIKAIQSDEARELFIKDMEITRSAGVGGFPSFLIKSSNGRQLLVKGYKTLAEFEEIISYLTNDTVKSIKVIPSLEGLNNLLDKHPSLAQEEIRQAFDFATKDEVDEWLEPLFSDGSLIKEEAGSSYFVKKSTSFACDLTKGIC